MTRVVAPPDTSARISTVVIGLIVGSLLAASPAFAQHRARIDGTLSERIGQQGGQTFRVIVDGPQDEVDRLARTYGLSVEERLEGGALLSGTGTQIDQLAGD